MFVNKRGGKTGSLKLKRTQGCPRIKKGTDRPKKWSRTAQKYFSATGTFGHTGLQSAHVKNNIYLPRIFSIFTFLEERPQKDPHGMKLL